MSHATVVVDVGEVDDADAAIVDALARLALALRRRDLELRLENVSGALGDLTSFMGLAAVLGLREAQGHPE